MEINSPVHLSSEVELNEGIKRNKEMKEKSKFKIRPKLALFCLSQSETENIIFTKHLKTAAYGALYFLSFENNSFAIKLYLFIVTPV